MQNPSSDVGDEPYDFEWRAGDMGCGELLLKLRKQLRAMPGKTILLTACDPGAVVDIPSYCRITGHTLIRSRPDTGLFWIKAKE